MRFGTHILGLVAASSICGGASAQVSDDDLLMRLIIPHQAVRPVRGHEYSFSGWLRIAGEIKLFPTSRKESGYGKCISGLHGLPDFYGKFLALNNRRVVITGELSEYNDGLISVNRLKPTNFTYFENFCGSKHVIIARSVRSWRGSDEKQ
jgi:hypothetical protein